ncbi:MAG: endolytic transglycosylase MltG [Burkholderiales bacterium]
MSRVISRLIACILIVAGTVVGWLWYYANAARDLGTAPVEFTIEQGSSLRIVAGQLARHDVVRHPLGFVWLARLLGKAGTLKAGNYALTGSVSPLNVLDIISSGKVVLEELRIIEGWAFRQMRDVLDHHPALKHETTGIDEAAILALLGSDFKVAEGLFFPDTYYFSRGMADTSILRRAYGLMQSRLERAWSEREPGLPFDDPYQVLILASIVEKETGQAAERPLIAGVFINRLKRGMKLQTDPTVIYGLGQGFDGNLTRNDLITDNRYNTYTREGLPPTPIALPGAAAILAVLRPARTSALYFVAKGDGSHVFSDTLDQHNRAVARYQLRRNSQQKAVDHKR